MPSPSHIHKSHSGKLWAGFRANAVRERAADVFGEKPYSERWRPAYMGANVGGYAFQAFGAALAYTAVADLAGKVMPVFPHVLGAIVAVAFLIGLEFGKRSLGGALTAAWLRSSAVRAYERVPAGGVVLLFALVALSVASSWRGAELLALRAADRSEAIKAAYSAQGDSLRAHYEQAIVKEEAALAEFKQSVSWRGHIDFRKSETRKVIDRRTAEIARLREELRAASTKLDEARAASLTANRTEADGQALIVACLSLALELLALVCIRFSFVYLHRVFVESASEGWAMPEETSDNEGRFPDLAQAVASLADRLQVAPHVAPPAPVAASRTDSGIGFAVLSDEGRKHKDSRAKLGDGNRVCKHCGGVFTYNSQNHVYCKSACRVAAWEKRTGRKFRPKGKR